jgi:Maltose operon periplasmic protein precursor (MalM)
MSVAGSPVLIVLLSVVPVGAATRSEDRGLWQEVEPLSASQESGVARLLAEQGQAVALTPPKSKVVQAIEKSGKPHSFHFGESRVVLFRLPESTGSYELKVSSRCNCSGPAKSVFVPTVAFLDEGFERIQAIEESGFAFKGDALTATLQVSSKVAGRYLLVYTRGDLVGQQMGTLRSFEGLLVPKIKYPFLRSAHGVLELQLSPTGKE